MLRVLRLARELTLADDLILKIADDWSVDQWTDVNVLVAVSGGSDSVALLRLLHSTKEKNPGRGELIVCHYNHRWRGGASEQDAKWVQKLAEELGLRAIIASSDQTGLRSEENLRDERRRFYRSSADECGARYLATAHTADDQAETVLFRLLRGTWLAGLQGITQSAPLSTMTTLVRPLLHHSKEELLEYLNLIKQSWRQDATNNDLGPTRNWIRNELLPMTEERIPGSSASLLRLAKQAGEAKETMFVLASDLLDRSIIESLNKLTFDCHELSQAYATIRREAIRLAWKQIGWPEKDMTTEHWVRLADLAKDSQPKPTQHFPGGIAAQVFDSKLVLAQT